jgi:hypothetical protein
MAKNTAEMKILLIGLNGLMKINPVVDINNIIYPEKP